jgi:acetylornithine deacetylase/succinyl-diaminopimelate desuccinylase-like protein
MSQNAETNRDHHQADGAHVDRGNVEDASPEIATIEADIERTREDLAQAVDQLAAKLDVKTRIRHRIAEARNDATHRWRTLRKRATNAEGRPTPTVMAVGGGLAAGMAAAVAMAWWRRNKTPHRRARRRR